VPRGLLLYGPLSVAAGLLFLPWVDGYFLGDDWMILARNLELPWAEGPSWFFMVRHDWYRPIFELYVAVSWQLFGLQPVAYHLVSIGFFVVIAALVGLLGESLTGDWRVGLLALALFGLHGSHAEPVLWLAASSELLVAVFVLVSLASYLHFRRTNRRRWLVVVGASFFLALASKETAVVLPLVWLVYEGLYGPHRREGTARRRWWPALFFLVPSVLYVAWRLVVGNPYPLRPTAGGMAKNVGHYLTLQLMATPIDFDYTAAVSPWQASRLLPLATTSVATCALAAAGMLWLRWGLWRRSMHPRALVFPMVFTALALAPVLPIVAERTAFLSSIGLAWALAALSVSLWDSALARGVGARQAVAVILGLFMAAQLSVLIYRCTWWGRADQTSRAVFAQLEGELASAPPESEVWVGNLPDHLAFAYVFRNAFPWAGTVLGMDHPISATLDTELADLPPAVLRGLPERLGAPTGAVVFWYDRGVLSRRR